MKNKKVVIVGGGTAGWMTAAYLLKYYGKDNSITVIESPTIPKIGVGESITPHVNSFFEEIGVPTHHWMKYTGAVYKYANKFVNWKTGQGEYEYFSFNYTVSAKNFYKDITPAKTQTEFSNSTNETRSTDYVLDLCERGIFPRFDQCFNPQFHYMEKNVAPFYQGESLLNALGSSSQHINAELASSYIKDHIAIPGGVNHIMATVIDAEIQGFDVLNITLDDGSVINGDLFIDCTGFSKVLIKKLNWEEKIYQDHPIDRAWVAQTDYVDPQEEMVNYTQSIAEPHGWRFKIGLYHRMGNGYCFSSKHVSEEQALEHFVKQIGPQRRKPRLIKWTPSRLKTFAKGNTVAIGLTCGFVEPLEANALYTIITSIKRLSDVLATGVFEWDTYNEKMAYTIDDIADFILVHYTLSNRDDTQFWKDMSKKGVELNHKQLIWDKYYEEKNSMRSAIVGYTMFPDYMWAQLAHAWKIPKNSKNDLDNDAIYLSQKHFEYTENKHRYIAELGQNNFQWLKENVFEGLSPQQWEDQFIKNKQLGEKQCQ
jgi:flavin-dependent dehydrogenase